MSEASRAINGFVAWSGEFVHRVIDNNGMAMNTEFDEQVAFLEAAGSSDALEIPDLRTHEDVIQLIAEIKYRLQPGLTGDAGTLLWDLNRALTRLVDMHELNAEKG